MKTRPLLLALGAALVTACATVEANTPSISVMNDVPFNMRSVPAPEARMGDMMSINGANLFVTDTGGAGDPLVLLHGYPLSGALFARVTDRLEDDYRVITIDHRGYGKSTTPSEVRAVSTYARDALAVLDRMDIGPANIGGMSMGGPIAMEMYRQKPSAFSTMILIDTNHKPAGAVEKGIWQGARAALDDKGLDGIIPFLLPNMLTGETRLKAAPAQVDYLKAAMKQASLTGARGGTYVLENRPDSTETLRTLGVPALIIVGREDTLYPVAISEEMNRLIPTSRLKVIPGAAHAAVFERPGESADAIRSFLNKFG